MKTYIALLRGVNVLGANRVTMKDLARLFETHGCADVRTYIQSGNVIFRSNTATASRVAAGVAGAISKSCGFAPAVLVLTRQELERAAAANPYGQATGNPTCVHLFFLAERPRNPDLERLDALRVSSVRFALKGKVLYLHTPDGFGPSKLARAVERLLGVGATARNWRTVATLIEMART